MTAIKFSLRNGSFIYTSFNLRITILHFPALHYHHGRFAFAFSNTILHFYAILLIGIRIPLAI